MKWVELNNDERDRLIAERVMEYRHVPYTAYCGGTPEQAIATAIAHGWYVWEDKAGNETELPDYTHDMNAAMMVDKNMTDRGFRMDLSTTISEGRYRVRYWNLDLSGMGSLVIEINPAEAICHAAALAVGAVEE